MKLTHFAYFIGFTSIVFHTACGKSSGPGAGLPLVTPPVKSATPTGLRGSSTAWLRDLILPRSAFATASTLSTSDFKSRFFSTGPTDILGTVLPALDNLITNINTQSASNNSACLTQTPVSYTVTPFGQTVTMYAQCYSQGTASYTGDPALTQFGTKDGVTYIYSAQGAEWVAAIITPITGSTSDYTVQAWIGLGYSNTSGCSSTWDGCSYGAMEINANSKTKAFEFAVAGMGLGYCGAQLKSDGTNLYATASVDMGTSCYDIGTLCVSASDGTTSGTCDTSLTTFALTPLGRKSTASTATLVVGNWGVSAYPATGANLTLDGSSTDDLRFGPTTPTTGVGNITTSTSK